LGLRVHENELQEVRVTEKSCKSYLSNLQQTATSRPIRNDLYAHPYARVHVQFQRVTTINLLAIRVVLGKTLQGNVDGDLQLLFAVHVPRPESRDTIAARVPACP